MNVNKTTVLAQKCWEEKNNNHNHAVNKTSFVLGFITGFERQDKWIDINDRMPKTQDWYLVSIGTKTSISLYSLNSVEVGFDKYKELITHWQPLIKPFKNKN
tara:strand:- start:3951 stop:4256 length:306 start_codon:yes stop_codon:yes gene_type:complete